MGKQFSLILVFILLAAVRPTFAGSDATLADRTGCVLLTDALGQSDNALAPKWSSRVIAALSSDSHFSLVPITDAMSGKAVSALSPDQKLLLLQAPDLLVASSHLAEIVPTRWLFVVNVGEGDNPAMRCVMYDLKEGTNRPISTVSGKNAEETLGKLGHALGDVVNENAKPAGLAVKGNVQSKLYHLDNTDHIQPEDCIEFASKEDAEAHGYKPCPICYPKTRSEVLKSNNTEVALGQEISQSVDQTYKHSKDQKMIDRINMIGERIVETNDIRDFKFQFTLLDSDEINAFSAGAGYVFITTGIVKVLESDDEIGSVLGHEMGHCENHHIIRAYRSAQTTGILGAIIGVAAGGLGRLLTNFTSMVFSRGFSRNFELQADHSGLIYAYGAGYDPQGMILVMRKLKDFDKQHKGSTPAWLRTHPTEDIRLDAITAEIGVLKTYDQHIDAIKQTDPGLAKVMRAHVRFYVDRQEAVDHFMGAYHAMTLAALAPTSTAVKSPTTSTRTPPSSTPPDDRD